MDGLRRLLRVGIRRLCAQVPYYYGPQQHASIYVRTVHSAQCEGEPMPAVVYSTAANPGLFKRAGYPTLVKLVRGRLTDGISSAGTCHGLVSIDGSVDGEGSPPPLPSMAPYYTYTVDEARHEGTSTTN